MQVPSWLSQIYHQHKRSFSRATLTAFLATIVDFSMLYSLVEFGHVYYVGATAIAAFTGAVTNFTLNKYWAFENHGVAIHLQGIRYLMVSGMSLLLNTLLVFCFTEFGHFQYMTSKVISSLVVGWGWNYPLHRYYVFPYKPT